MNNAIVRSQNNHALLPPLGTLSARILHAQGVAYGQ